MTATEPGHRTWPCMQCAQALADTLATPDRKHRQTAIAEAAHYWLINRHQLAKALAQLDKPTVGEILATLQEEPTP